MKVSYDEGPASHIGPESCGGVREDRSRSVDRGTCGLNIESRKLQNRRADAYFTMRKAMSHRVVIARPEADAAGSQTSCTHGRILRETPSPLEANPPDRKPGDPAFDLRLSPGPCREPERGTTAMYECGKSDRFVVPMKSPNKGGVLPPAEGMEERRLAKESPDGKTG